MFIPNDGNVAKHIIAAVLAELERSSPGFTNNVQARLNAEERNDVATPGQQADIEAAASFVRSITP